MIKKYINKQSPKKWPVSIAPMIDWTDRHYRYFMRQITRRTLLYTEMKTTDAIIFGDREKIIGFSREEKPLVLQLGGDDPRKMARCAKIAEDWGYDEVNINVGCPSARVQRGNFGASLMSRPELIGECVAAMQNTVSIPVTVKNRIGIDELQEYEHLAHFVEVVSGFGCRRFIVHARIAMLQKLSPKENRTVPPLRYQDVYRLKKDFPELVFEINGGIKTLEDVHRHLKLVDGVMIGRAAYENPFLFANVDSLFYDDDRQPVTRREVIQAMIPYLEKQIAQGNYPNKVTRHMLGLFSHQRGTKSWKRYLSNNVYQQGTQADILLKAIINIPEEVLDSRP